MLFYSSRSVIWILLLATVAWGQTVATVNNVEITQKQVDDSVAAQIYPLQQQLYAIRKAALENLITTKILESEAAARRISIDDLRKQLTLGEVNVTRAQVEEAYKQNASFFATMSPDEARERLRLDLENQARMKHYRTGLDALRRKWTVTGAAQLGCSGCVAEISTCRNSMPAAAAPAGAARRGESPSVRPISVAEPVALSKRLQTAR